jgi:hypothetical protein
VHGAAHRVVIVVRLRSMKAPTRWQVADVAATLIAFVVFLVDPGINRFYAAKVVDMVHGAAFKPYVYRALVPTFVRGVVAVMPDALRAGTRSAAATWLKPFFDAAGFEPANAPEHIVGAVVVYAALLGFLYAMRANVRAFYAAPPVVERLVPIVTVLVLPAFFGYASFLYDTATLLFAALGLLLIATKRWSLYVAVFTFAVFNKETGALLLIPFVASHKQLPRRAFVTLLAGQLAILALSRIVLRHAFGANRGEYLLPQWSRNLEILHHPPILKIAFCTLLVFVVVSGFRRKPWLLRWSLVMIVPLVGTCALWGYFDELRAYYDAYPTIALLATPTIAGWFGQRAGVITKSTRLPTDSEKYALAD